MPWIEEIENGQSILDSYHLGDINRRKQSEQKNFPINNNNHHDDDDDKGDDTGQSVGGRDDPSLAWKLTEQFYTDGPDQLLPSEAIYTWKAEGATRIVQIDDAGGFGRRPPISIPSLLKMAADRAPNRTAMAIKRKGGWQKWTFRQYLQDVRAVAKAFICLGLERYQSVCILGLNTPEWFLADLGAIFAGGFACGIYTTNSPEAIAHCAKDSRANILVVEDDQQLAKIMEIRDQLIDLKAIVQYTGEPSPESNVLSWTDLLQLGNDQEDILLEQRLAQISINQCSTLIYTSGTTGNPKGVMLSHDNLTWTAYTNSIWCGFKDCQDEIISYLPLSHVAAQIADIYTTMTLCVTVYFGDKNALKGSLIETMKEVRPTKFLAVPRVWEKMYERMQEIGRETKGVKRMVGSWAKSKGMEHNMRKMYEGGGLGATTATPTANNSLGYKMANKLVLSKIRDALGLSRCNLHLSAAAPLGPEILKYFMSLDILITEIYGMSECTGPQCVATDTDFRIGSCGKTLPGCLTQIEQEENKNGEILMAGRNVFMGYLHQPEKTMAALDSEGWLHSEDVGHVDRDGYLFITGRIKELLITAGGENVAPVPIEDRVKHELPIVSQAVVLGDRLKYLSVLLTFKTEVDKDTQKPLDSLIQHTKNWIQQHGDCMVVTVQDALGELYFKNNHKLRQAIQQGIDRVNTKAVSQAQRLHKWQFLPTDFSIMGGELGPTLKLKRQTVYGKYQSVIENIYLQ